MVTKFKHAFLTLVLALVMSVGFSQSKDTLYSENICLYTGPQHQGDVPMKTEIIIGDSVISFKNLGNDSVFIVKRFKLQTFKFFPDGQAAYRWDAEMKGKPATFGIQRDVTNKIVAVAITRDDDGLIFLIVPKETVLPNKNTTTDVTN